MYDIEIENRFWIKILTGDINECWECVAMAVDRNGYGQFCVNKRQIKAHRFSFQLYHNRLIKEKMLIMHSCNNPSCVNPNHLSEGTNAENMKYMVKTGQSCRGSNVNTSKFTEKQVREIRTKYANGGITYAELAKDYCVCNTAIGCIIRRETWKHLPP